MKKKLTILLLFVVLLATQNIAQKTLPWKKRVKLAENFERNAAFYQAAVYYEGVYAEKPDKEEYIYKAGQNYYLLRDYINAVKCLQKVKDNNDKYDKPGYKYALALKQTGKYEAAKKAFSSFISNYEKEDKETIKKAVDIEIQGCNFALNAKDATNGAISIEHLDAKINTNKTEFAPIPFNDNVLYFSSSISGVAKIYRSQKSGDKWSRPQTPNIFVGKMEKPHFGNGTFTPDGKRFYFTQCSLEDGKANCAIYLMTETAGSWSDPIRLPPYINAEGTNTTHPYVVKTTDKEILYFASDREGGRGGLDLWFCTKTSGGNSNNYTLPKNLGRNINTPGDDITPFYDKSEGMLYFSSNGRISAGGFDVFKSKGEKLQWEVAQNMGFPTNSSADDLYYTVAPSHGGGYFISNRMLAPQKISTIDDDVFYYGEKKINVSVSGLVTDANNPDLGGLADVNVKLFLEDELLHDRMLADGQYKFKLKPKQSYTLEFSKEGYMVASFDINTEKFDRSEDITKDVGLEIPSETVEPEDNSDELKYIIVPAEYNSQDNPYIMPSTPINPENGEEYTGEALALYDDIMENVANESPQGMVYYDGDGGDLLPYFEEEETFANNDGNEFEEEETAVESVYSPDDVAPEGIIYRIQVAAVRRYKSYKYEDLNSIGQQFFEEIDGGIRRVMLVPEEISDEGLEGYKSKGEALNVLSHILNNTRFDRAFVIKYQDGERIGEGFRGLDEEEGLDNNDTDSDRIISEDYEGF